MADAPPHADLYAEGLARLFTLSMELAEHAQAHALASDDPTVIASMGGVFAKAARSARQTAALAQRHAADQVRATREAAVVARREYEQAVIVRKEHLDTLLRPEVWREAEAREEEELTDDFEYLLGVEARTPTFTTDSVEAQLARLRDQLGLGEEEDPTSPNAAALAGGGPPAEERGVKGASPAHHAAHRPPRRHYVVSPQPEPGEPFPSTIYWNST